jgi:hypothetical protein
VAGRARPERRGQRAPYGADLAAKRQLAGERAVVEQVRWDLAGGDEQPDGDRQVEAGPRLAHVRGREVHRDPLLGELELGVEEGCAHPLARLTHRPVGQADEHEGRQSAPDVDLDGHLVAANPLEGECCDRREHRGAR